MTQNIFHIDGIDVINTTLKYVFIDSYKAIHRHCDYNRCGLIIGLYYLCKLNINLNANIRPAGIWTRISETQSGYANHWATLHWHHEEFFDLLSLCQIEMYFIVEDFY